MGGKVSTNWPLGLSSRVLAVPAAEQGRVSSAHYYAHPTRLDIYVWTERAGPGGVQCGHVRLSRRAVEDWLRAVRRQEQSKKARRKKS